MHTLRLFSPRLRLIRALLVPGLLWLFAGYGVPALAQGQSGQAKTPVPSGQSVPSGKREPKDAAQWLAELAPALTHVSYEGVFVYSRGGEVNSMRVFHRFEDGHVRERLVQLDGANGEVIRDGSKITYIYPDKSRIRLSKVLPSGPFAEAFSHSLAPVTRWYRPQQLKDDRVAGYATVELVLKARDRDRYSYRLWLEKKTGLLVKSEVLSLKGRVLERFQFTDLDITQNIPEAKLKAQVDGRQATKTDIQTTPASSSPGQSSVKWRLGWRPKGFDPTVGLDQTRGNSVAYSDGMASFSVFVDPRGSTDMPSGASRIGATTAFIRKATFKGRHYLVTVVGEIPPKTAMEVAEGIHLGP